MNQKISQGHDKRSARRPFFVRWYGRPDPDTGKQQRYSEHFATKHEADIFAAQKRLEQTKGGNLGRPDEISLERLCRDFLQTKNLRPQSVLLYQNTIQRLLSSDLFSPNISVRKFTPRLADKFISSVKPMRGKRKLSTSTQHRIIRHCVTIFRKAQAWGCIEANPFASVERPKITTRPWHYLTPEQYHRLLDATPDLRTKALYALCYTGGLRLGEVCSLLWSDISFEDGAVTVRDREGTADLPGFSVKDHEQRTIPLPGETMKLLAELRKQCFKAGPFVVLSPERYEVIKAKWQECRKNGGEIAGREMLNHVRRQFLQHLKRAGIIPEPGKRLSVHEMRKAAILNWAKATGNPKVTQVWAGHSDLKTTMRYYSQVTDDQTKAAIKALDSMLGVA
jgi:integrase